MQGIANGGYGNNPGGVFNIFDSEGKTEAKTKTEMQSSNFVNVLNSEAFKFKNNAYPVLIWE